MAVDDPKRRAWQSGDDRDLASAKARRDHERDHRPTEPLPMTRRRSGALATAVADDELEKCDEWEADTGVTDEIKERVKANPELHLLFRKLIDERKRRCAEIMKARGEQPEAMSKLERNIRWAWKAIAGAVVVAVPALVLTVKTIYFAGGDEREASIERRIMLEDVATMKAALAKLAVEVRDVQELARSSARRFEDMRERLPDHSYDVAPRRRSYPTRSPQ